MSAVAAGGSGRGAARPAAGPALKEVAVAVACAAAAAGGAQQVELAARGAAAAQAQGAEDVAPAQLPEEGSTGWAGSAHPRGGRGSSGSRCSNVQVERSQDVAERRPHIARLNAHEGILVEGL